MKIIFLACFTCPIECDKRQGTVCKGPKGILAITVEVVISILWDLRGCWKHKIFEKKANFPVKKKVWPLFSCITEHEKRQETIYKGPDCFLEIAVENCNVNSLGPKKLLETEIFQKERQLFL